MNVQRTLVLGVSCGALVVWIAAAATSTTRVSAPRAPVARAAVEASGAALASEVARLHERLRPTTAPLQSRDLFRYGSSKPSVSRGSAREAPAAMPAPALVAAPPPLKLVGIAEDAGNDGAVRTAIISGAGDLFLAKEGDVIARRYRVARIDADGVELVDVTDAASLRLALR